MKNLYKWLGIIVVMAAFALALATCKTDGGGEPEDLSGIRYNVSQTGGTDSTKSTTGISFTFAASIDDLGVEIADITVGGKASKGSATFTGSGKSWTLSPITVNSAGRATVTIKKEGIQSDQRGVLVYKSGETISATELVADIRVGWNLGNTFDASVGSGYSTASLDTLETAWVKTKTTQANIDALYNAGFNAIRIPVSWYKVANPDDNYKIRDEWMTRVKQVVDYAVKNDMYIILNTHHDEGIFKFMNSNVNASLDAFEKIWKQIAEAFKDYDEKLIFEALNEPRTKGSAAEWQGGTKEERDNLNQYYVKFVEVVRASGGKNTNQRFLLINTYAASAETAAMEGLTLPTDTVQKKLIASYHAYSPYEFALSEDKTKNTWSKSNGSDTSGITYHINRAQSTFISKGIPVIIGEFGAMNKDNVAARAAWAEYYTAQARAKGIPCFWWDNGATTGSGELFGLLDRNTNKFIYPEIVEALMKGSKN